MAKRVFLEAERGKADRWTYCSELEAGNILFCPQIPFSFPQEEIDFLLMQRQMASKDLAASQRLKEILHKYSERVAAYLSQILAPYAGQWKLDYARFHSFQEEGGKLRLRARNDLLHVDASPARPVHGWRILRFFTNINPTESRKWITSQLFAELCERFAGQRGLTFPSAISYSWLGRLRKKGKKILASLGLKLPMRSPYDHFMLRMQHFLKKNTDFQRDCPKDCWEFPPNSCWAVFTDQVSHAALPGQYALEQTFLVPEQALLRPETSPASVLQMVSGCNIIDVSHN